MKFKLNQIALRGPRLLAALGVAATLAIAPGLSLGADKDPHEVRAEQRVNDMHSKLKITTAQQAQWATVSAIMLDNAKVMDVLTQKRADHAKTMTAVDDLVSYGEISEAHTAGIKKLTPAFTALYDTMSDAQKKQADTLFRHGESKTTAKKPATK